MLKNWFKVFVYNSLHNKLFFLLTVFGLATGMTGVILAMLYWEDEHAYNQWNPEKEKVAEVIIESGENKWPWIVAPLGPNLKEASPELDSYLYYNPNLYAQPFRYNGKSLYINRILNTQPNFFDFFPFEIIKGDLKQFGENNGTIALEEKQAKEIFGNEDPIGKVFLNENGSPSIVSVVFRGNDKSSMQPNLVTSELDQTIKLQSKNNNWNDFNYGLLVKAKDASQLPAIKKRLDALITKNVTELRAKEEGISVKQFREKFGNYIFHLPSLADVRLGNPDLPTGLSEGKGNKSFLTINVGLSFLILIISIFNYINLSTAYAMKRAKEIGVRKVIGASTKDVVLQLIDETAITSIIASFITLALVEVLLPYYNNLLGKELAINFIDFGPYFFALLLIIIALAGVFPALYVAKFEILKVIKGNFSRSQSGIWVRNTMIVIQFCIATFFIISGIVVARQVDYAMEKDLGFHGGQVVSIGWDKAHKNKFQTYERIKQDIQKIPGVREVSASTFILGVGAGSSSGIKYKDKSLQSQNMAVDFGYLGMLGIRIIEGRNLSSNLASDTLSSALLNRTAVEMLGEKDPLNKEFSWGTKKFRIVGVVDDFHLFGLDNEIPPMTFIHIKSVNWMQNAMSTISVKLHPDKMERTIAQLENYWIQHVDSERPFNCQFVDKMFARTYQQYVKQRNLFTLLTFVVISIALLGLFALASYTIERKYKEIAIKKVLGAETKELVFTLTRQYLILLFLGFLLAIVPSFYLMQLWLSNFVYRIDIPLYAYGIALSLMLILTLAIVLVKAYSASRINSLTYIKYE